MFSLSGERLSDQDVDTIVKHTELQEDLDGNVKYEGKYGKNNRHSFPIGSDFLDLYCL